MRIISGEARGRRLRAPAGDATRPILDLQKQRLFDILKESLPCGGVLDVFAGSGSLGLEALSRGAERATFVDRARPALEALRDNVEACGFAGRSKVLALDAFAFDPARVDHAVGLVFLDPPFPLYLREAERLHGLLAAIAARAPLEDGAVLVLRVPAGAEVPAWPAPLAPFDRREYGESVVFMLRRAAPPAPGPGI